MTAGSRGLQSLTCTEGKPWGGPGRPGGGLGKLGEAVERGWKQSLEEGTEKAYRGSGFDATWSMLWLAMYACFTLV